MNLKPILARLESAMGRHDLMESMVLLAEPKNPIAKKNKVKSVNFIVGYNSSPKSQTALDITLWIAHQTRLATSKEVTVQVVYVVDESQTAQCPTTCPVVEEKNSPLHSPSLALKDSGTSKSATPVLTLPMPETQSTIPRTTSLEASYFEAIFCHNNHYEEADRLLWQARCLADEWRGLFKAHLRFGNVAKELREIVEIEAATLLFVGCTSVRHPLVQQLGSHFPCSVLGIPSTLTHHEERLPSRPSSDKLQFITGMRSRG